MTACSTSKSDLVQEYASVAEYSLYNKSTHAWASICAKAQGGPIVSAEVVEAPRAPSGQDAKGVGG